MGNKVRKTIVFRFNQYKDLEVKLEAMANKGLFLEKIGTMFWTFRKENPKKLKYTVTYFPEASIFNPTVTNNQKIYLEKAKELGWNLVAQLNQLQIFCNSDEDPIPFETDEREKFENIKKCMRKSFLPSTTLLLLAFILQLRMQYTSYTKNPIDALARTSSFIFVAIMVPTIIYLTYTLVAYFVWCKQCEKSLSMGEGCAEKKYRYQNRVDGVFISYTLILGALFLFHTFQKSSFALIIISILQVPILMAVFRFCIYYLKKKKHSATLNRIVSYTLLVVASFTYSIFIAIVVTGFNSLHREQKNYEIYSNDIPLKYEDLYGDADYEEYSYEKDIDESIFLTRSYYRQDFFTTKNAYLHIEYMIIEPKFDFVYDIVANDLKKIPNWSDKKIAKLEDSFLNTTEAYQLYYENREYKGEYVLLYKDKIIWLDLKEELTEKQAAVVIEKLEH